MKQCLWRSITLIEFRNTDWSFILIVRRKNMRTVIFRRRSMSWWRRKDTQLQVAQLVPGRRVSYLTSIPAQKLDLYWVGIK